MMYGPYADVQRAQYGGRGRDRFGNAQKLVRIYEHTNPKTGYVEKRGFFRGAGNKLYRINISEVRNPRVNAKGETQCNWVSITEVKPIQGQALFNGFGV